MRYDDAIKFIFNLELFGIKMGLDNITRFLARLGDPQNSYKTVHVAGTNGKGSVSSMLFAILDAAGYRCGVFTSPHLVDFRERVRTSGGNIDKRSLAQFVDEQQQFIRDARVTFFELSTALALWYFRKQRVEIAVIEVGLGGRLDATNVLLPEVSIITHIDYDHTKILGKSLTEIAREKAGIIKTAIPLVTGERRPELLRYFRDVCRERGTRLWRARPAVAEVQYRGRDMLARIALNGNAPTPVVLSLPGEHQLANLAVVLKAIEQLRRRGLKISDAAIRRGLKHCRWPARFQVVSRRPTIVLDVAHNADGMRALTRTFQRAFPGRKALVLCGFLERPDHDVIMKILARITRRAVLTRPESHRAAEIEGVIWAAVGAGIDFDVKLSVADAVDRILQLAGATDIVLICGSHYTVGAAIQRLHKLRDRGQLALTVADITLMNG